jgi:hypothetical protein
MEAHEEAHANSMLQKHKKLNMLPPRFLNVNKEWDDVIGCCEPQRLSSTHQEPSIILSLYSCRSIMVCR